MKNNQEQIESKKETLIRQARNIAVMRRKNALWKEIQPKLNRMGATVKEIERLESQTTVAPKAKRASSGS